MITKAEVIDMYLSSKREAEKLFELIKEDVTNPKQQKMLELIQIEINMIDLFIEAINQDEPTQEELQHHFNRALSFGTDPN